MHQLKKTEKCPSMGFLAFLRSESVRQKQNGHISTASNYHSAGNSFSRFLKAHNKRDVPFSELTPLLISDYEAWLQVGGLCKNTSSFYMRCLQSVYHKAVSQGLTADRKPFAGVFRGVAKTVKRAIDMEDVCRLKSLDIRAALVKRGCRGKRLENLLRQLELARDIFLFCFCARGLTFVDLAYMQKTDISGGMLIYVRRKTQQRMEVRMEAMMREIIRRHPSGTGYLLPILTKTGDAEAVYQQYRYALSRYNAHLPMLGEMLGGLKLTSYVCRHSWASAAYKKHIPLSVISQSMGHDSEKTTEIYLKSLEYNVINKTNHELLASVFKNDDKMSR